jgi:hypothetical protein
MKTCRGMLVLLVTFALLEARSQAFAAPEPEQLPSMDELHKLFDDGQYQPLLNKLARVLQLKGNAAAPYDRVDLLLLRSEALLQLKQSSSAVAATNEAVKAITDQTDPKVSARARATAILFKRMQGFNFTPKTAPKGQAPKPVSLLDLSLRKSAFEALLPDVQAEVTAKAKGARGAKNLVPIVDAIRSIGDLRAVEMMAEKEDSSTSQKLADELAGEAKTLIGEALKTMDKRVAALDDDANQVVATYSAYTQQNGGGVTGRVGPAVGPTGPTQITYHKKGIDANASRELNGILDTCGKIVAISRDFADISKAQALGFKEVMEAAVKTGKAASTTLNADYSGTVNAPQNKNNNNTK